MICQSRTVKLMKQFNDSLKSLKDTLFYPNTTTIRDEVLPSDINALTLDKLASGKYLLKTDTAVNSLKLGGKAESELSVSNADTVDGKHASDFLAANAQAVDSALLGGKKESDLSVANALKLGGKAENELSVSNADTVDGKHASDFLSASAQAVDSALLGGKKESDLSVANALKLGGKAESELSVSNANTFGGKQVSDFLFASAQATDSAKIMGKSLLDLRDLIVPIGFCYTQFSNTKLPGDKLLDYNNTDITSQFPSSALSGCLYPGTIWQSAINYSGYNPSYNPLFHYWIRVK